MNCSPVCFLYLVSMKMPFKIVEIFDVVAIGIELH